MPDRIRACRIVVSADSTNVRAVYNLGVALSMERQFAPAESAWARYTALDPKQFAGYYNLGLTREYRREYPGALTAFRSALRYASHPAQEQTSCFHMGVVQYNLGQAAEALQWIRSAIAMDTSDLAAWSAAAIIAETQKRDSDAVSYWTRVGKANPDFLDKISPQEKADYEASLRRVGKQHPAFIAPRSSCRDTPSN